MFILPSVACALTSPCVAASPSRRLASARFLGPPRPWRCMLPSRARTAVSPQQSLAAHLGRDSACCRAWTVRRLGLALRRALADASPRHGPPARQGRGGVRHRAWHMP
eukprot:scaffold125226_cov75-Phaeocystis_antarctica.AAC.1